MRLYPPWYGVLACKAELLSAEAAVTSMDLVLSAMVQGRDASRGEQVNIDGDARCDSVHAGSDQDEYVVLRQRLRRAKQSTIWPSYISPQAGRAGWQRGI